MKLFGSVEAGGTKFVCMIAESPDHIVSEVRFPTTTPGETLGRVIQFFSEEQKRIGQSLESIGIACFGPLDLNISSPGFGSITSTPKPGWENTPVLKEIQERIHLPVKIDTDVNAAAIGEGRWGAAKGLEDYIYITIGTGIGGGAVSNGRPIHGLVHPEMGHMQLPHDWSIDPFAGICPYHGDCWEGMACGPAIKERWNRSADELPLEHQAWELEANYIGRALQNLVVTLSPQRIILGGGVMQQRQLFPMIRTKLKQYLNKYVQSPSIEIEIEHFIVEPGLGSRSGIFGGLALALEEGK